MSRTVTATTILCWGILGAAAGAEPVPLTLPQAVELALSPSGSIKVRLAGEGVRQASERTKQARGALLPNVDGQGAYQNLTRNLTTFGISLRLPAAIPGFGGIPEFVGPFDVVDLRVSASQSVFDLAAIRRYQASKLGLSAAEGEEEWARDQAAAQVSRAYLAVVRARQAAETAQANVALAERLLALARAQRDAGTATGLEVTRAAVQLAQEQQRRIAAVNQLRLATLQLLRAVNLPLDSEVAVTGSVSYMPIAETDPAAALAKAAVQRADLRAQIRREEAARMSWAATKAERWPSVAASGDYGSTGTALDRARPTRAVGLAVRIPVWDGGRRDARRAESASAFRAEELRTRDLRKQVELELRAAADALHSAAELVKAATEAEKLAEAELAHAERRYRAGAGASLEVSGAQTRLSRARENKIDAMFLHTLARLDWLTAQGAVGSFVSGF